MDVWAARLHFDFRTRIVVSNRAYLSEPQAVGACPSVDPWECLRPIDDNANRSANAQPIPSVFIDNVLNEDFAREFTSSYPSCEDANLQGRSF